MYLDEKKSGETIDAVGEVLLRAADYMEKHGHCKFKLKNVYGAVCFNGALIEALRGYGPDTDCGTYRAATKRCGFADSNESARWNNAPERTAADVIARLRASVVMDVVRIRWTGDLMVRVAQRQLDGDENGPGLADHLLKSPVVREARGVPIGIAYRANHIQRCIDRLDMCLALRRMDDACFRSVLGRSDQFQGAASEVGTRAAEGARILQGP